MPAPSLHGDYSSHVQFYTTANYQTYDIKWQDSGYNELRVASGVRIIPDGQALFTGESVQSLVERLGFAGTPSGSQLSVSTGYSWFGLPDMKMVTVMSPPVAGPGTMPSQALRQETNASNADGLRTDLRLANFAEGALPDGRLLSFGLSGFYANYQSGSHTHCMYTVTTDCAIVNIVDFSSTQPNNTGLGGELNVDRAAGTWIITEPRWMCAGATGRAAARRMAPGRKRFLRSGWAWRCAASRRRRI